MSERVHSISWAGQPDVQRRCDEQTSRVALQETGIAGVHQTVDGWRYTFDESQVTCHGCSQPVARQAPRFIVLEGIDGAGTTTQTKLVASALRERGHEVVETREPSDGQIGALIRRLLAEPSSPAAGVLPLLFAADRLDHLARVIEPALAAGKVVICDRYTLSSEVYQGRYEDRYSDFGSPEYRHLWLEQFDRERLDEVRRLNVRARKPDACYLLDIPAEEGVRRVAARSSQTGESAQLYDGLDLQRELAERYRRLSTDILVKGDRPPEKVTAAIMHSLMERGL